MPTRTVDASASVHEYAFRVVHMPEKAVAQFGEMVEWAEEHLGFTFTCGNPAQPPLPGGPKASTTRHWVKVNPHTGDTIPAPTDREREKTEALHFLWAMKTSEVLPCTRVGTALATWVGPVHPGWIAPWPKGGSTHYGWTAVRTVLRAIEYHDAGFDLTRESDWLRVGVHPDTLRWMRDLLISHNISLAETNLRSHVLHVTGTTHKLKPGQKAVSDTAWLTGVIQEWVRRRVHG